jgi:23S rRNA pseudouridine955/2504/2580 synthase
MKNITVLFENERCLVLNKPAGLAVQGGEGVAVSLDSLLAAE